MHGVKIIAGAVSNAVDAINRLAKVMHDRPRPPFQDYDRPNMLHSALNFDNAGRSSQRLACVSAPGDAGDITDTVADIMALKYIIYGEYYQACLKDAIDIERVERITARMVDVCDSLLRDIALLRAAQ